MDFDRETFKASACMLKLCTKNIGKTERMRGENGLKVERQRRPTAYCSNTFSDSLPFRSSLATAATPQDKVAGFLYNKGSGGISSHIYSFLGQKRGGGDLRNATKEVSLGKNSVARGKGRFGRGSTRCAYV